MVWSDFMRCRPGLITAIILAVSGCVSLPKEEPRVSRMEVPSPAQQQAGKEPAQEPEMPEPELEDQEVAETCGDLLGQRIAEEAVGFVGQTRIKVDGVAFRRDCSGFVMAVFASLGCDRGREEDDPIGSGGTASIWERCEVRGELLDSRDRILPGDLVFFDNTYDRNDNGRCDDELTHVGIAAEVLEDGTLVFVHRGWKGVRESRLNVEQPGIARGVDRVVINDMVRPRRKGDRACVRYLAGELLRGACRIRPDCARPLPPLPLDD